MVDYYEAFDLEDFLEDPPIRHVTVKKRKIFVWRTLKGDDIKVNEMEDGHLLNAHRMLRRGQQKEYSDYRMKWIRILLTEMRKRGLKPLQPYPGSLK
jgi:hypothetical protein